MSNVTPTPGPLGARYVSGEVSPVANEPADARFYVSCGTATA